MAAPSDEGEGFLPTVGIKRPPDILDLGGFDESSVASPCEKARRSEQPRSSGSPSAAVGVVELADGPRNLYESYMWCFD
jgi:hypothetical protein